MAAAFAIATLVAVARAFSMSAGSVLLKAVSHCLQLVAVCVLVLVASAFSESSFVTMMASGVRPVLPWLTSLLFVALAFVGLLRGAQRLPTHAGYASLVMLLSLVSFYGSYRVVLESVPRLRGDGTQVRPPSLAARLLGRDSSEDEVDPEELANRIGQVIGDPEQRGATQALGARKSAGASEEDDLRALEELEGIRKKNSSTLEKLQETLPAP